MDHRKTNARYEVGLREIANKIIEDETVRIEQDKDKRLSF
jgi:hypothetical protein